MSTELQHQLMGLGSSTTSYELILKSGETYSVSSETVAFYASRYPHLDIHDQFRQMEAWLFSNPSKRKTKAGILRFVNHWLNNQIAPTPSRFQRANLTTSTRETTIAQDLTNKEWAL